MRHDQGLHWTISHSDLNEGLAKKRSLKVVNLSAESRWSGSETAPLTLVCSLLRSLWPSTPPFPPVQPGEG